MAIAVALVLLLFTAIGLLAWNSYRDALSRSQLRVSSASQVVSTHIEWLLAASLEVLREADALAGGDLANVSPGTARQLRESLQYLPAGVSLSFVDPSGKTLFSTAPEN